MRKVLNFLLVALMLLGSQTGMAQTRESCVTYDPGRTLEGFKQVILTWKDPFIQRELWPAYAKRANEILQTSKLERVRSFTVTPDSSGMTWLMEHSKLYTNENFDQANYLNGIRVDNHLDYQDIPGLKSNWVVFEYEDVRDMYAKSACCNAETPKPKPKPAQVAFVPPVLSPVAQILNLNLNIGFKDTLVVKHTFDPIHLVFDNQPMVVPKVPEPYKFVPDTTTKTKWYQTTVAKVVGGALLIYGGYELAGLLRKAPKPYVPPVVPPVIPPVVEPRTMPPGIPAVPVVPTTPGLPSDPRTMPPGIPAVETPVTGIPGIPEQPTTNPDTPVPAGLPADTRGMPGGISSIFPAGKIVTVGFTFPAPWGRR